MPPEINLKNIISIYELEISKSVKNKRQLYNFECNKIQHLSNILSMLKNNNIGHKHYNIFLIYEPKVRLVMSLSIKDKIINHFLTRFILEPKLTKYLDDRNCATRKNMGTDYALKLVKKYLEIHKRKKKPFYILKVDIKKYFYNIDHKVLKSLLFDKLSPYEYNLISQVIDSTNASYINERIAHYLEKNNLSLPFYLEGKGLPIGNMTSQFLSIFYLYKLDHYIVHNLHLKYYVRYMDDFIIVSDDLNKLKKARQEIINILKNEYLLEAHEQKTTISNAKIGFSFLGYTFKVINNKTIINIRRNNCEKIKKKVKAIKYKLDNHIIDYNQAFCAIMTYVYSYKYCNNIRIKNIVDRYFYNEK